ncbi:MAG: 2-C-methyl-D-erythritol 4-phosphate cytidylyltransferase [Candidatus Omnitrophica bacterium]|nr:2-C-methyl-D-erythritol 4-phosphate cytidylyltransferase [Candidatus Omnitrophota bacterium]
MLSAIILAAGRGKRLASSVSKPLVKINNKPLINYSLDVFNRHPAIDEIIIVYGAQNKKQIFKAVNRSSFNKIKGFIAGGRRRQDSVYNGLKIVSEKCDWVLIHDSARPFIDSVSISKVIRGAGRTGAAILGVPVKATIKTVISNRLVDKTVQRRNLWEIQTPQVFKKVIIGEAYKKYLKQNFTDDASLVERLGGKVKVIEGRYENIKVTTRDDLLIARLIAKRLRKNAV